MVTPSAKSSRATRSSMSRPLASSSPDVSDKFTTPIKSKDGKIYKSSAKKKQSDGGFQETPTKGAAGRLSRMNLDTPKAASLMGRSAFDYRVGAPSLNQERNVIHTEENDDEEEGEGFLGYGTDEGAYEESDGEAEFATQAGASMKMEHDEEDFVGADHPSIPRSMSNMDKFRKKTKESFLIADPNGRKKGRRLVMWHRPRMMEKLLLNLQYECHMAGIKLPWDAAIQRLNPGSGGPSAVQMLNKVRDQLVMEGHMIPPTMGKGHDYHESIRGFVRDMDGPTVTTTKVVRWSDQCDNRKVSLQDHGMVRGSGKYRQVEMLGLPVTKVPRTQAQRGGPRNLIPKELVDEMNKMKKLKDSKPKHTLYKRGPYKPRVKESKIKSEKFFNSDSDDDNAAEEFIDIASDDEYKPFEKPKGRKKKIMPRLLTLEEELNKAEAIDEAQSSVDEMNVPAKDNTLLVKLKLAPQKLTNFPAGSSHKHVIHKEDEESGDDIVHAHANTLRVIASGMGSSPEIMTNHQNEAPQFGASSLNQASHNRKRDLEDASNTYQSETPRFTSSSSSQAGHDENRVSEHDSFGSHDESPRNPSSTSNQVGHGQNHAPEYGYSSSRLLYENHPSSNRGPHRVESGDQVYEFTPASAPNPLQGGRHAENEQDWTDVDDTIMEDDEPVADGTNMDGAYVVTYDSEAHDQNQGNFRQFVIPAQSEDIQSEPDHYEQLQESIFEGSTREDLYGARNPHGHFMHVEGQIYDDEAIARIMMAHTGGRSPTDHLVHYDGSYPSGYFEFHEDYNENQHHSGRTVQGQAPPAPGPEYYDDEGGFEY